MNEHLFKLKKDGKTVGYLKIDRGLVCWKHTTLSVTINETWYTVHNSTRIDFNTTHPFVTKDKNGKDVFAGDRIRRINGEPCFIKWYAEECRYVLHNNQNYYDIDVLELEQGIELIEDKAEAEDLLEEARLMTEEKEND